MCIANEMPIAMIQEEMHEIKILERDYKDSGIKGEDKNVDNNSLIEMPTESENNNENRIENLI